jgi:hypothetical protein
MTDPTPSDAPVVPATPAAAPAAAAPAAAPAVVTEAPRKSKALGVFALLLGLGAFIGDIVLIGIAIAGAIGVAQSVSGGNFDFSTLLAGFAGFAFIAFIGFWVGIGVAALAMLLGIIAAVKNRGRAAGIFGAIFGLLVLISHLSVAATILGSAETLNQLNGLGT